MLTGLLLILSYRSQLLNILRFLLGRDHGFDLTGSRLLALVIKFSFHFLISAAMLV